MLWHAEESIASGQNWRPLKGLKSHPEVSVLIWKEEVRER